MPFSLGSLAATSLKSWLVLAGNFLQFEPAIYKIPFFIQNFFFSLEGVLNRQNHRRYAPRGSRVQRANGIPEFRQDVAGQSPKLHIWGALLGTGYAYLQVMPEGFLFSSRSYHDAVLVPFVRWLAAREGLRSRDLYHAGWSFQQGKQCCVCNSGVFFRRFLGNRR